MKYYAHQLDNNNILYPIFSTKRNTDLDINNSSELIFNNIECRYQYINGRDLIFVPVIELVDNFTITDVSEHIYALAKTYKIKCRFTTNDFTQAIIDGLNINNNSFKMKFKLTKRGPKIFTKVIDVN